MASSEEIVRAAYRTAEGNVQDLAGWRNAFTEHGSSTTSPPAKATRATGSATW